MIVVPGICIAGIIAFLLDRVSSAKLEGEILTSSARFSTTRVTPLLRGIGVVWLSVDGVRLDDPAARAFAAATTWFDSTVGGGMSRVSGIQVPESTHVEIRSVPNTSFLEVVLRCRTRCGDIRIDNTGRHEISIPGPHPLRVHPPPSYSLEPTAERVTLVLKPADAGRLLLAQVVPIGALALTDIEDSDNSVESFSRSVSSILGGKYRLPESGSQWEDLQAGTWLSLAVRDGTINQLVARGDTLQINFEARISSATDGRTPVALMPTWIEWLGNQHPYMLLSGAFAAVAALVATLAPGVLGLWKEFRRGPDDTQALPGPEQGLEPAKVTILFLGANSSESPLELEREVRKIQDNLKLSREREYLVLKQEWAVTIDSLMQAMLDESPTIVHFSGHGLDSGIILQDGSNGPRVVSADALSGLFELFKDTVRCVVLNSCYSEHQAQAIRQHIPYVIGMRAKIPDSAAIAFSTGFYKAIGAGRDVPFAFDMGEVCMKMEGFEGENISILI